MSDATFFTLVIAAIAIAGLWWLVTSVVGRRRPAEPPPDELVVIATRADRMSAEIARAMLERAGIPAHVRSRLGPVLQVHLGDRGDWEILVRYRDAEAARANIGDE